MKRTNKALAVILTFVMVFSVAMISRSAHAEGFADYLELTVSKDGDTVTLTLTALKDFEAFGGFETAQNGVTYDSAFTFDSADAMGDKDVYNAEKNKLSFGAIGDDVKAGDVLLTMTFTAGSDFDETQDYDFTIDFSMFFNSDGESYDWAETGTSLTATLEGEEEDTTEADTTEADTTEADTTEADTTEADTTEADTTEADTTEADTTEADTTEADTTEADTTAEETTAAETTAAETTSAETTAAETTAAPETTEADTTPQTGDDSHMTLWYIVLAASVVGLGGVVLAGSKKRKED